MRIALMVEGQEDVTWSQWVGLARTVEDAGLEALFRSDHYVSVQGRTERGALDAWSTIAALGAITERIRLGTLVSPTTFRHPSVLAKQAVTADHVSGGRVELGMGAGWHELEHTMYGFGFGDVSTRYSVFAEQVEIVHRQLHEERFDHDGAHYRLEGCEARPKPVQSRLPLILGGLARSRSAALAARFADEYNTVFPSPDAARERGEAIARACEQAGREPIPLSMMTGCLLGQDEAELRDRAAALFEHSGQEGDVDAWLQSLRGEWIVGTVDQAAERLEDYARAGVSRVMLQHQLHWDLDMVRLAGRLT